MENLPKDVLVLLAMELDYPSIIKFCRTNKNINRSVCKNNDFWRNKFYYSYPFATRFGYDKSVNIKKLYAEIDKEIIKIKNNPSKVRLEGFQEPKFIVPELVNFLLNADFGNYHGIPLNYILYPVLENHILILSIAITLFTLHLLKNKFVENDGKKFFKVSPEMNLYLDSYLTELEKKGGFDRNKFVYNKISFILAQLFRKNVELTPQQIHLLNESHPLLVKIQEIILELKNNVMI